MKHPEETPTEIKKRRTRRSPEKIVELVMKAERTGNAAEICRREGISQQLMYRWKNQFKEMAISGFKQIKAGRPSQKATAETYKFCLRCFISVLFPCLFQDRLNNRALHLSLDHLAFLEASMDTKALEVLAKCFALSCNQLNSLF